MRIVDGILYDADAMVADWVHAQIPQLIEPFRDPKAMGIMDRGVFIAGVVWHDYTGHDLHLSAAAASPRWARKGVMRAIFHYPFVQLGCRRVTATTGSGNVRLHRFVEGIGMMREGVLRQAMPDGTDLVVYGLLCADCRWIN